MRPDRRRQELIGDQSLMELEMGMDQRYTACGINRMNRPFRR